MIGAPQMSWRQIMQMPQQMQMPSGRGFPTQNATGGWQMGAAPVPQAPAPITPPVAAPMMAPQPMQDWRQMMPNYFHDWNSSFSGR